MTKRLFTMLECQSLMENFSPFSDTKRPKRWPDDDDDDSATATETSCSSSSSSSSNAFLGFPVLPEEPSRDLDGSVLCRLCVRLPDGRKVKRNFLETESVQLLWSFCYSQIDESERMMKKPFKLIQAFPGSYKTLHYGSNTTFQQSGLANSVVSMTWVS